MEEVLRSMVGRKIDVSFGNTAVVRGVVAEVTDKLVAIDDEEGRRIYVAVGHIAFCSEVKHEEPRAGFLNQSS